MRLVWSNLADGWKQKWEFTGEYEHTKEHRDRPVLPQPRRLSWRECALIQTFPTTFEPAGNLAKKIEQIGNAVPPLLMEAIMRPLISGQGLRSAPQPSTLLDMLASYSS
jgi:DNA (cytosine-5)-methyltransferase 1